MKTSTCSICGHTYDEPFADIFGGPSRCPKCHPYVPGTAKGETEEKLAAMECEHSIIRPIGKMLMNPRTGTVQSEAEWLDDYENTAPELWGGPDFEDSGLVEVRRVNGEWVEE